MLICLVFLLIMIDVGDVLLDLCGCFYLCMVNVLFKQFGLSWVLLLDLQMECVSFLFNLCLVVSMICQGKVEKVLVVCSEYIFNLFDFILCILILFVDGCVVVLLICGDDDSCDLLVLVEYSDVMFYEVVIGCWCLLENLIGEVKLWLYFLLFSDGQNKMVSFVLINVLIVMCWVLEKVGLGSDDIDYFVFYQLVLFLVKVWVEGIGVCFEQY